MARAGGVGRDLSTVDYFVRRLPRKMWALRKKDTVWEFMNGGRKIVGEGYVNDTFIQRSRQGTLFRM